MPNGGKTVTRLTQEIPTGAAANHFNVDPQGNVTIKSKEISDAIKSKIGGGGGAGVAAIRVAVDSG